MFKIEGDEEFVEWYENASEEERQLNSVWKFSLALILLSAIIFVGTLGQTETAPGAYEVRGVSKGAVHVIERATGAHTELRAPDLVKQALAGKIKRGDIIYR
ncbi:hypothetical protein ACFYU8_29850 [Brevibacillus sp. NPDC003359]|uniref:hypothetical protein n=1 Tax=unclassified Brevibacillus TaxID=2684853 RepID=UPI00369EA43D